MKRPVKWFLWVLGGIVALLLLLSVAAVLILPSAWFRDKVRVRMVAEIERVTGGNAEIGAFRFDWKTLHAEVAPFVLRGTEPATERPLFRAESVQVGLKIVSLIKKDIDIASLTVQAPQVNILVDEQGKTNIPEPKIPRTQPGRDPIELILSLAVDKIDLKDGLLQYADKRLPLTLQGENLLAHLDYHLNGPSYRGSLSMDRVVVDTGKTEPMMLAVDTQLGLYKNRIHVESARLSIGESRVDLAGSIEELKSPRVAFEVKANVKLADVGTPLKLPIPHIGQANFDGTLSYNSTDRLLIAGRANGSGLAFQEGRYRVDNIAASSDVHFTLEKLELRRARVNALGGVFQGTADLVDEKQFHASGQVEGMSLAALSRLGGLKQIPYSASISGPVEVSASIGGRDLKAGGKFQLTPTQGGVPVSGFAELAYNQKGNTVELGNSRLTLPATRLNVSGTLGSRLQVHLESRDLHDLLPALSITGNAPEKLPLRLLEGGTAVFDGTVTGPFPSAVVNGIFTLTNFEAQNQKVDRLVANVNATSSAARISSFALGQEKLRLEGSADLGLQNWKLVDASRVDANVKLQGADIEKLLKAAGQTLPIQGQLTASAALTGTASDPRASLTVNVEQPVVYGEKFDRVRAEVKYAGSGVEIIRGVAELGAARVLLNGAYEHPPADYKNGRLRFDLSTQNFALERIVNVQQLRPGVRGQFELKANGVVDIRNGQVQPEKLDGLLAMRELVVDGRELGNFTVDAKTANRELIFGMAGNLRGSKVVGSGTFQLAGDYPGSGSVDFSRINLSTLQDLAIAARGSEPLPMDGFLEGKLTFSGPVRKPEQMRARLVLPALQIAPARRALGTASVADLTLRNAEPVVAEYDGKAIRILSAHLVGPQTDMRASGSINLNEKSPWDLRVDGDLNLGVLANFNADVVSSGAATINASLRGTRQEPQLSGKMELKDASFHVTDLPNGLDNANGVILFDRRRATIEKLTAETGGGTVTLGGFVGYGSPELTYQLQARTDNVRIRYPEGVSTTVSSTLNMTGSSSKSLLSGVVTIRRAGFNPRTDIGGILASSSRPVATPVTPNPLLRGMQLDIRVETAPNLQFQTSLTSDLQAEADLRVRGTAAKPTLLGRITVNQGEVQFFGNKYTINRGEIGFFNPVKLEPVLDMDLETRVRGVLVTINFTGPLSKLNVSYRSDPPLQSNEIIALLAVGRAPGTNTSLASGQTVASQNVLASGSNSLLGQAVAAPISGRLQRFFGVSRLKIDPQLTGINAVPQARLTIEQQISRDITLTYITNLAQANAQIIRLEWAMNRNWSVVALREDNGSFGIDFFFKRRL